MISLESIGIKLMQGATQIQGDFYGYATDEFSVVGSFSNDNLYKWDHLLNQVEWYISSDKFNIPLPKNQSAVLNDDEGHYYPLFPRDYAIFSNETIYKFGSSETTFPYLEDIGGRHLVFSVIPAAKSGKLGVRLSSKPIYISGLPVTDNLITHLDASYIDVLSDTTEALLSGTEYLLKVWYDISSIHGLSAPSESAVSPNNYTFRPFVYRTDVDDPFSGQYVKFDSGKYVQINQGSSGGQVTVYAALRNRSDDASAYLVNGANALSIELPVVEGSYEWSIIRSNLTLDGNGFRIGDSKTDIAELIIYSGSLSDEDNSKVLDYLSRKYSTISIILNE